MTYHRTPMTVGQIADEMEINATKFKCCPFVELISPQGHVVSVMLSTSVGWNYFIQCEEKSCKGFGNKTLDCPHLKQVILDLNDSRESTEEHSLIKALLGNRFSPVGEPLLEAQTDVKDQASPRFYGVPTSNIYHLTALCNSMNKPELQSTQGRRVCKICDRNQQKSKPQLTVAKPVVSTNPGTTQYFFSGDRRYLVVDSDDQNQTITLQLM